MSIEDMLNELTPEEMVRRAANSGDGSPTRGSIDPFSQDFAEPTAPQQPTPQPAAQPAPGAVRTPVAPAEPETIDLDGEELAALLAERRAMKTMQKFCEDTGYVANPSNGAVWDAWARENNLDPTDVSIYTRQNMDAFFADCHDVLQTGDNVPPRPTSPPAAPVRIVRIPAQKPIQTGLSERVGPPASTPEQEAVEFSQKLANADLETARRMIVEKMAQLRLSNDPGAQAHIQQQRKYGR